MSRTTRPVGGVDSDQECTGLTADWCPIHGYCTCRRNADDPFAMSLDDPRCPLHQVSSTHGEG